MASIDCNYPTIMVNGTSYVEEARYMVALNIIRERQIYATILFAVFASIAVVFVFFRIYHRIVAKSHAKKDDDSNGSESPKEKMTKETEKDVETQKLGKDAEKDLEAQNPGSSPDGDKLSKDPEKKSIPELDRDQKEQKFSRDYTTDSSQKHRH